MGLACSLRELVLNPASMSTLAPVYLLSWVLVLATAEFLIKEIICFSYSHLYLWLWSISCVHTLCQRKPLPNKTIWYYYLTPEWEDGSTCNLCWQIQFILLSGAFWNLRNFKSSQRTDLPTTFCLLSSCHPDRSVLFLIFTYYSFPPYSLSNSVLSFHTDFLSKS